MNGEIQYVKKKWSDSIIVIKMENDLEVRPISIIFRIDVEI